VQATCPYREPEQSNLCTLTHFLNLVPKPEENNKLEDQDKNGVDWTHLAYDTEQ
jgi:hypothetical protein